MTKLSASRRWEACAFEDLLRAESDSVARPRAAISTYRHLTVAPEIRRICGTVLNALRVAGVDDGFPDGRWRSVNSIAPPFRNFCSFSAVDVNNRAVDRKSL